jgi:hypothetical protein
LETKKIFDFNHLAINPTMFMTQSYYAPASVPDPETLLLLAR